MKKVYLIITLLLFSFGCINFNFDPSINIAVKETSFADLENTTEDIYLPIELVQMDIYEILNEENSKCILNDEIEVLEINKNDGEFEIKFKQSDFFVNVTSIICLNNKCIVNGKESIKELDYDFLKTFSLMYENYVFECESD